MRLWRPVDLRYISSAPSEPTSKDAGWLESFALNPRWVMLPSALRGRALRGASAHPYQSFRARAGGMNHVVRHAVLYSRGSPTGLLDRPCYQSSGTRRTALLKRSGCRRNARLRYLAAQRIAEDVAVAASVLHKAQPPSAWGTSRMVTASAPGPTTLPTIVGP
jgi:hypothetical protein